MPPTPEATYSDATGSCTLVRMNPGVVVGTLRGHLGAEAAPAVSLAIRTELSGGEPAVMFWDCGEFSSYHSEFRVACTNAIRENLGNVPVLHIFLTSKIVAMGVSVANLAVGGRIKVHQKRATFDAELDKALKAEPYQPPAIS